LPRDKLGPAEIAAIDDACPPEATHGDYYGGAVREHIVVKPQRTS